VTLARKVKIRRWVTYDPNQGGPESAAYQSYLEQMTFRWSVICQACYAILNDAPGGCAVIAGERFSLSLTYARDRATTINEEQYRKFQRKEAAKLGIDLGEKSS
jgi:hypothetical protein